MKSYLFLLIPLLSVLSISETYGQDAQKTKVQEISPEAIEVYYFHNTRRCATCEAVENTTKETLQQHYTSEMEKGEVVFQSINLEDEKNEELARSLKVSGQTLLIVKQGKKKDLTNDAFMYARSKPEKLEEKIIKAIDNLKG